MLPPPAWPYSALYPLVSTVNWSIASTEGELDATQLLESARLVLVETPSSELPYAAACPPPMLKPLSPPMFLASGVREARSNGVLTVPFTTRGRSLTSLFDTVELFLASSVCNCTAEAFTSITCVDEPTSSFTSARTVVAASTVRPFSSVDRKPCLSTRTDRKSTRLN